MMQFSMSGDVAAPVGRTRTMPPPNRVVPESNPSPPVMVKPLIVAAAASALPSAMVIALATEPTGLPP